MKKDRIAKLQDEERKTGKEAKVRAYRHAVEASSYVDFEMERALRKFLTAIASDLGHDWVSKALVRYVEKAGVPE